MKETQSGRVGTQQSRARGRLKAIAHGAPTSILRNLSPKAVDAAREEMSKRYDSIAKRAVDHITDDKLADAKASELIVVSTKAQEAADRIRHIPTSVIQFIGDNDPREVLLDLLLNDAKDSAVDVDLLEHTASVGL